MRVRLRLSESEGEGSVCMCCGSVSKEVKGQSDLGNSSSCHSSLSSMSWMKESPGGRSEVLQDRANNGAQFNMNTRYII